MTTTRWIERTKRGRGAVYSLDGETITDELQLEYFKSLGIPPAWKNVRIARSRSAKVLATGVDNAGRAQYRYHPKFRAQQEQFKFERILRFARALPKMRQTVDEDLGRRELDYRKVMASIVSIMDQTYIRVGNDSYARDNNSYGLTTLRSKHTEVQGSTITFEFVGKSGKHHVKRITDKALARIVRQLDNLPGYEVFKYYDEHGQLKDVKSSDVNAYIKEIMGDEFSAKDFRTWAGTLIASGELAAVEQAESERERKKLVTACVKKVSKKLSNTPAIARSSYIDPRIIQRFMDGEDLSDVAETVKNMKQQKGAQYLSPEEKSVLCLLEC
ncbi:MAG TPA: hypothetical protein VK983_03375 [Candidatus Limnocylindrales bacterium]|nr:hypothetical protein [Candidatus Limnocylindrales bacterium]